MRTARLYHIVFGQAVLAPDGRLTFTLRARAGVVAPM